MATDQKIVESKNLAWVDVETTGLDPDEHILLEVGIVVTEKKPPFSMIAQFTMLFSDVLNDPTSRIDPFVLRMHTESGLLEDIVNQEERRFLLNGTSDINTATHRIQTFLEKHNALGSPMCGSTIFFDRAFLKKYLPDVEALFHYRNIDVSSLKNTYSLVCGDKEKWKPVEKKAHRPIEDLLESIAEFWFYLKQGIQI